MIELKNKTNALQKKIFKEVKKCLEEHNLNFQIVETTYSTYFEVDTRFGTWRVTPEHENREKLVTIYTRWQSIELVDKSLFREFRLNEFSGKMNFHYFKENFTIMMMDFSHACDIVTQLKA